MREWQALCETYVISDFFERGPVVEGDAIRVVVLPLTVLQGRIITRVFARLEASTETLACFIHHTCHSLVARDEKQTI